MISSVHINSLSRRVILQARRATAVSGIQRGFTLLELMICIAIIAMTFAALTVARNNCLEQTKTIINMRVTSMLAERKLNEILVEGELEEGRGNGSFEDYPDFGWESEIVLEDVETQRQTANQTEQQMNTNSGEEEKKAFKVTVAVFPPINAPATDKRNALISNSTMLVVYKLQPEDEYKESGKVDGEGEPHEPLPPDPPPGEQ